MFIQEIECERYQLLIDESTQFVNEIIQKGAYILDLINNKEDKKSLRMETMPLMLILREYIEILDGIKSIVSGNSLNMINILIRNLLECTIYTKFMFQDKEMAEERAAAYQLKSIYNKLYECKLVDSNDNVYAREKKVLKNIMGDAVTRDSSKDIETINKIIDKYPLYTRINQRVINKYEEQIKRQSKKSSNKRVKPLVQFQRDIQWYNMVSKERSLKELAVAVDMECDYLLTYKKLCEKTHIGSIMSGMEISSDYQLGISNPKFPQDIQMVCTCLKTVLRFSNQVYSIMIDYFLEQQDKQRYSIWYIDIMQKRKKVVFAWEELDEYMNMRNK